MDRARQFAAFVPDLVLERLASDPAAPATAREDAFLAAILFVDIVGYVRLSGATHRATARRERRGAAVERLATSAAAAADQGTSALAPARTAASRSSVAGLAGEKMRDVVNATFAGVVDVVRAHGGDVLKFAGDAIFAAWPVKGPPQRRRPEHHPNASERRDALLRHEHRASELGEQCLRAVAVRPGGAPPRGASPRRARRLIRRATLEAPARANGEKKKPKKPKKPNTPSVPTLKMAGGGGARGGLRRRRRRRPVGVPRGGRAPCGRSSGARRRRGRATSSSRARRTRSRRWRRTSTSAPSRTRRRG
jgi:class 3 adenylate cyclase